ncbi:MULTISPECIES: TetR/AcrR family transcriptional regulator [Rhodococcus]|uniref:TetR/AcrR family transcriptional regulator n=1 Tax=Rhodococcus oxybenzonivorans TaxID=1990687 RepID=A0AAE5A727_9NOCA|nr:MULTISPECIES: TetR/AcrR family transcriptional regulator [Rhodococcus]MDV7245782.1 TetR/AcrR family transcriptional regulator [Rhodococcus oxybenzonivorans]MDV7265793.1 TetR/AcrR family transcriptional regulator [Rhodococcus oxybenzonivorans]MDV7276863.1 TetR/AcrR family transcriptional regulator [Rhodococcus oxybenzonivorans]MDV7336805.1 TetR/AcrR family transcriptional regulator [Rhodococcus oxybenzonivorans]MDV7346683.1 TetR/AcrR family transcriptional regulator [Rhodococcus oxybenzonivo
MTESDVAARRANKRGLATRESLLDAAIRSLASGDPGAVSGNRIAKDIGATWGTIKYQFGDIDGLWSAVLRRTAERRGDMPASAPLSAPLRERVTAIVDNLYDGLAGTDSRAIETLRAAMPSDREEFERLFPLTAAEFASWRESWLDTCRRAFTGLDVDPERVAEVAAFIPGAMRGIVSEKQLGSYVDLDLVRRGFTNAVVSYLQQQ